MRKTVTISVQKENNLNHAQKFTYILQTAYFAGQLRSG